MDLADYKDAEEFLEACYELHKDEEDPELMFQDYEADESWEGKLYSECSVPEASKPAKINTADTTIAERTTHKNSQKNAATLTG